MYRNINTITILSDDMSEQRFKKKCLVCGDKALGKNFDALSCESCKAFFRRTALKNIELRCEFSDSCKIDVYTRRFCMKCRLRKCFEIGMKKEWILTSDAKKERKQKIELNKKRKQSVGSVGQSSDSTMTSSPGSSSQSCDDSTAGLEIPDTFDALDLDLDLNLDLDIDEINTQITEIEKYIEVDEEVVDGNGDDDWDEISDETYEKAVELEFSVLPIARPVTNHFTFNELEANKLAELFSATSFFHEKQTPFASQSLATTDQDLMNCMSFKFEQQIHRIIKMSKAFTAFNSIIEADKMTLIREGVLDLFCIRSVPLYDHVNKSLDDEKSVIFDLEAFKKMPINVYELYVKFLNQICKEWESDPIVLDLLTAIVLFNPDRPKIENKQFVNLGNNFKLNMTKKDPDHMSPLMKELFVEPNTSEKYVDCMGDNNSTKIIMNEREMSEICGVCGDKANVSRPDDSINDLNYNSFHESFAKDIARDETMDSMSVTYARRPITDYRNNFNEIEGKRITELLSATNEMRRSSPDGRTCLIKHPLIEEACKAWAHKCVQEVDKLVKMSKCLVAFNRICDNDRIALIKYGSVEERNNSVVLRMDLLKEYRKSLFDAYDRFIRHIGPEWDSDTIIIDLLTAIVIFNPNRPDLMDKQQVQVEREIYMQLLLRYLLLRYRCDRESTSKLWQAHQRNYRLKDPKLVPPLLREVFEVGYTGKLGNSDFIKSCLICGDRATGYNFNAEWILNSEQKNIRRNKIEENRQKRKNSTRDDGDNTSTDSSFAHFTNQIEKMVTKLMDNSRPILSSNVISDAIYEMSVIPIARPVNPLTDQLNDIEMNRLAQLLNAMLVLKSPIIAITSEAMTEDDGCDVWRYHCEQEILKITKMSKLLEPFQKLCPNDQIALVKYGCVEMHFLRLTIHYNFDNEYWSVNIPEWESDPIILDILTAILLFNPDRPNLLYREMVKLQQHIYMYLLQRYVMTRYPTKYESNTKFMRLMSTMIDLNIVRESHVKHMELEAYKLSPLLREICDLVFK
ncbi:unnamed protein product [Medioppia subpectinata]|uniref:Uncharacterized protein n=1 Tax=Medioppia subpectinata TaxID=1979941 RepID=A0A7R9PU17_9ACAR|nr:unnamed protein product [Medioppia subpectinata]CAG2101271.1 unnamed protein product [Medioppia subpectinata]